MDGIKKTAILLSGLEWNTVDQLLRRLEPETARLVRREMMSQGAASPEEANRLASEFLRATGNPSRSVAGETVQIHETMRAARTTYAPPHQRSVARFSEEAFAMPKRQQSPQPAPQPEPQRPFDFLRGCETEQVVREISGEHPQTVAVVLAHLPPSQAGAVLNQLPKLLRIDVARRLAEFDEMDEQLLQEIESTLKQRFEERMRTEKRRNRGQAVMSKILEATDSDTQALIMDRIRQDEYRSEYHNEYSTNIPELSLESLERLNDSELATLFQSVDTMTAMLALIGAKPNLIQRIVHRLSPTEEHRMRQQLKQMGAIDPQDILRARQVLLEKNDKLYVF